MNLVPRLSGEELAKMHKATDYGTALAINIAVDRWSGHRYAQPGPLDRIPLGPMHPFDRGIREEMQRRHEIKIVIMIDQEIERQKQAAALDRALLNRVCSPQGLFAMFKPRLR